MPEGIIATDNGDGFVTLDFVDPALRGPALAQLIEIGGPSTIETITRKGPRRQYRVPLGNATDAGLVDEENTVEGVRSAGADTGFAQKLIDADPNVNPGADHANWHTPTAEYTSANKYVGTVANDVVLDRVQVHTGDAGSYGGSPQAPTHREVIDHVKGNSPNVAVGGRLASTQAFRAPQARASEIAGALADQTAALGSDPGAWGDPGGEALAEDYTTVQASRDGQTVKSEDELSGTAVATGPAPDPADPATPVATTPTEPVPSGDPAPADDGTTPTVANDDAVEYPQGTPSTEWRRDELDAYALNVKGLDTTGLANKAEVVTAINAA